MYLTLGGTGFPPDKKQGQISTWQTPELDFPTFMWGLLGLGGEREQEFALSLSLLIKQLFLWRSGLGNGERTEKKIEWLCNRRLVLFQIRLLYSDAGGERFQAAQWANRINIDILLSDSRVGWVRSGTGPLY